MWSSPIHDPVYINIIFIVIIKTVIQPFITVQFSRDINVGLINDAYNSIICKTRVRSII
jgi:hypothetical protein